MTVAARGVANEGEGAPSVNNSHTHKDEEEEEIALRENGVGGGVGGRGGEEHLVLLSGAQPKETVE